MGHARRLKEDSTLLLRGFDSVAQSLSQLSNNLGTALEVTLLLLKLVIKFCDSEKRWLSDEV